MLPILLYAAAKAYRSREDAKAQDLAFDRQNTVYEYGFATDDNGNPTGAMRLFDPKTDDQDNWQGKYMKFGPQGQVSPISSGTKIEAAFTDFATGITGKKSQFFDVSGTGSF